MGKFDLIVIGFGKAGKTLAADMATNGYKVALIEKSNKMYGGTCINVGCIPTKSLVNSSKFSKLSNLNSFEEKAHLYKLAIEEKNRLITDLRKKNFDKLNNNPNVTIYNGEASFVSKTKVKVKLQDDEIILEGDKIFINTGSTAILPKIEGIENNKNVYISETILDLDELPKEFCIIGGGYIGLEFASMYSNFGSRVTVFQDGTQFLPREDNDIADEILKVLKAKGIEFKLGVQIKSIKESEDGKSSIISYINSDGKVEAQAANAILLATGRKANIQNLNPLVAGIEITERGVIKVNEYLKTNLDNVWAMGDVAGGLQFTYVSLDDYRIVKSQLLSDGKRTTCDRIVPYSVFIDPCFSRVGLNEKEAKEKGYNIKVAKLSVQAIPKAQILKETQGILKTIVNKENNQILGAMLFCAESYEMINIVKLVIDSKLPYTVLRDQIFTHPTMSESLNDLYNF